MSDLKTNVIALPATTGSITWYQYSSSDSSRGAGITAACHRLLDARIPCTWLPSKLLGSEISDVCAFIESTSKSLDKRNSVSESGTKIPPALTATNDWDIWVFHAFAPEQETAEQADIPNSFHRVDSGVISWKTPYSESHAHQADSSTRNGTNALSSEPKNIDRIFDRALDNMVDRALTPLSIVRFGFRQWITLAGLESPSGRNSMEDVEQSQQHPLTPTSPNMELPPDMANFLSTSRSLDTTAPGSARRNESDLSKQTLSEIYVLRFTISVSNQALLIQPSAQLVTSLRQMSAGLRESAHMIKQQTPAEDFLGTSAIAAARIAPYGIRAEIVSEPTGHLGEIEEEALDAWSVAFGYSREILTGLDVLDGPSCLVWIRLKHSEEPFLYPRRLVFVDHGSSTSADLSLSDHQTAYTTDQPESSAVPDPDANIDVKMLSEGEEGEEGENDDKKPVMAEETEEGEEKEDKDDEEEGEEEEGEEGEELGEEGEYDEEGEIADPVAPVAAAAPVPSVPITSPELDAVIASLRTETSRSMEKSILAIQESMSAFQVELRIEQQKKEEEEAAAAAAAATIRKREKQQNAATEGTKLTQSKSASGGTGTTKKRQRSNTRDEGTNKSRRKSVSSGNKPAPAPTSSSVDTPLQVATPDDSVPLINSLLPAPSSEATAAATETATTDIDMLFGDTGVSSVLGAENSETPVADLGLGFGQLGDDMGLGMGIGMGDGMDAVGMGDFSATMFGVTDDDFNFFDSVPSTVPQPKPEPLTNSATFQPPQQMQIQQPLNPSSSMLGSSNDDVGVNAVDISGSQPFHENIDDLFDDGMFDSFFGSGSTSAAAPVVVAASAAAATNDLDMIEVKLEPIAETKPVVSVEFADKFSIDTSTNTVMTHPIHALSSPPGVVCVSSLADTNNGLISDSAAVAEISGLPGVGSGTELATPAASIKMTPAPSTELQQMPTPVAIHPVKTSDSASAEAAATVAAISADGVSSLPAQNSMLDDPPFPLPLQSVSQPAPAKPKHSVITSKRRAAPVPTLSMTPRPYSSITTPYDDVGIGCHSWLQDSPAPPLVDTSGFVQTPRDELDSHMSYTTLIERSLNPVSWIRRVAARRMQRASNNGDKGSNARSARRLKGWLASYRAKSSYTQDFVPNFIRTSNTTSAADTRGVVSSNTAAMMSDSSLGVIAESCISAEGDNDSAGVALAASTSQETATAIANGSYVDGALQQYSSKGNSAGILAESVVRSLPSFTSIINPRNSPSEFTQMPGALAPSLSIADLQTTSFNSVTDSTGASISDTVSRKQPRTTIASIRAIKGGVVPWWMHTAGALADSIALTVTVTPTACTFLRWVPSIESLMLISRSAISLVDNVDCTYVTEIALALSQSGNPVDTRNARADNLGARIGGLLKLGPSVNSYSSAQEDQQAQMETAQTYSENPTLAEISPEAVSQWMSHIRQTDKWVNIVEIVADWAAYSPLLASVDTNAVANDVASSPYSDATHLATAAISTALMSFWSETPTDHTNGTMMDIDSYQSPNTAPTDLLPTNIGPVSLAKLVALENPTPSPTAKYRGFVVKKRRGAGRAAQSSSLHASLSSGVASETMTVPSGVGTIEPLLDVNIVVGTYGQQDAPISTGSTMLCSRDSKSLYIKRWRYTQCLGSRAIREARIAAGEIEETEEGEEREDGEDGPSGNEQENEVMEDWPDPDSFTMEAEDALRRACIVTSPLSLRWWAQMHMRPIGASKDVRWCTFVPPCTQLNADDITVKEWCQVGSQVAEWYLEDVDSAYQASHLGTHQPLGLQKVLDGTFTELTDVAMPSASQAAPLSSAWSTRLLSSAERFGSSVAHAWYTTSQLEQHRNQQRQKQLSPQLMQTQQSPQRQQSQPLVSATTLVLYMWVPHSRTLALWLSMAEASRIAVQAFETTLGSLIARTAKGVPSSTTSISGTVPWPSVLVHPLPLDLLSEEHGGRRLTSSKVPSPQETAITIYNRCPEFLASPPPLVTLNSASTTATGVAAIPQTITRQSSQRATPDPHDVDFIAAALGKQRQQQSRGNTLAAPRAGTSQGRLTRRSGYLIHHAADHVFGTTSGIMQGFVHRAYIISAPCTFPSVAAGASTLAPATMSLARAVARTDIVSSAGMLSREPSAASVVAASSTMPRPSVYPAIPTTASIPPISTTLADGTLTASEDVSTSHTSMTSPSIMSSLLPTIERADEEVLLELEETRVEFDQLQHGEVNTSLSSSLISHPLRNPSDQTPTLHCIYTVINSSSSQSRWIAVCWCDERGEYVEHDTFKDLYSCNSPIISPDAAGRIWAGCLRYQDLFSGHLRIILAQWQGMSQTQAASWNSYATAWQKQQRQQSLSLILVNLGLNPPEGLCFAKIQQDGSDITHTETASRTLHSDNATSPTPDIVESADTQEHNHPRCSTMSASSRQCSLVLHSHQALLGFAPRVLTDEQPFIQPEPRHQMAWATGYLLLQQQSEISSLCVQLTIHDSSSGSHEHASLHTSSPSAATATASASAYASADTLDARKFELMTARSVIKQYYQLAWLRHADHDARAASASDSHKPSCQWPVHFLPLPISIVEDIRCAIEPLL